MKCQTKSSLDGVAAVWRYSGVIRMAIVKFKYNFSFDIASELAILASGKIKNSNIFSDFIVVSIPLYPARERWRGFNQADLVARELSLRLKMTYYSKVLVRVKNTQSQVSLTRENRLRSIRGVFAVNKTAANHIFGKRVVIIDDVCTTGATLSEAAIALKQSGAREVWGLTLAR